MLLERAVDAETGAAQTQEAFGSVAWAEAEVKKQGQHVLTERL